MPGAAIRRPQMVVVEEHVPRAMNRAAPRNSRHGVQLLNGYGGVISKWLRISMCLVSIPRDLKSLHRG